MVSYPEQKLSFRPLAQKADESLGRIRAMLSHAHSNPELLRGGPNTPPAEIVIDSIAVIQLHVKAIAEKSGREGFSEFKDAVTEDAVLGALRNLPDGVLRNLEPEISYLSQKSYFESVRIAASFCLDSSP